MQMTKPSFVYVTYIATTPEKLWQALVDTDVMAKYWVGLKADSTPHVNVSDWKPGSRWEHQRLDNTRTVDVAGTVIESNPHRRLVYSWARPNEIDDATKRSRVTFDIEPQGADVIRLTVTHEGLEHDPQMLAGISGGWPQILSNLKSLLETGRSLPRATTAN
jgi:uncharacterized protein YndB with AHSA1/START domain